jgi:hypothetical protein
MCSASNDNARSVPRSNLIHRLPELFQILKSTCAIRISHKQPLAARVKHPMSHSTAFTKISLESDDPDITTCVSASQTERGVRSSVGRSVIDDDDFERALSFRRKVFYG